MLDWFCTGFVSKFYVFLNVAIVFIILNVAKENAGTKKFTSTYYWEFDFPLGMRIVLRSITRVFCIQPMVLTFRIVDSFPTTGVRSCI